MIYAFCGRGEGAAAYTGYQYTAGPRYPVSTRKRGDMLFWPVTSPCTWATGRWWRPQSGDVVKISPVRMAGISPMVVWLV